MRRYRTEQDVRYRCADCGTVFYEPNVRTEWGNLRDGFGAFLQSVECCPFCAGEDIWEEAADDGDGYPDI